MCCLESVLRPAARDRITCLAKLYVFYHFFHPDRVVSSVLFSELCLDLAELDWEVTAFPSNRDNGEPDKTYPSHEIWEGVRIERVSRPSLQQSTTLGRVFNAIWMLGRWSSLAFRSQPAPDVILIGTDPIFSVIIAPVWRFFHPQTKIVHWCFDLYPEAAYADGILPKNAVLSSVLTALMRKGYRACDLVVDIGSCMRQLLHKYDPAMRSATLVPWALSEPDRPLPIPAKDRFLLFGDAKLALMYSGSFGRAHSYEDMLKLMWCLRGTSVSLALSIKGNSEATFHAAVTADDTNIQFIPFAPTELLEQRLASADIHVISLREEWTGTVVPSKFFGALAVGRPVLFCGSRQSSLAEWIEKYRIGWVLEPGNAAAVAECLRLVIEDSSSMEQMKERCYQVYKEHFSRAATVREWNRLLSKLAGSRTGEL
jgi:colanic acid biosynthesis glycosyl transferase WcaI